MAFDESEIEVVDLPQRRILYAERRADAHGSFNEAAPAAMHAVMEYATQHNIPVDWSTIMGITPDDMTGDRANVRYWGAFVLPNGVELPPSGDIQTGVLAAGRELTYTYRGPYAGLIDAWMEFEAYRSRHDFPFRGPAYEVYIDDPWTTPESELRTILHIPLQD